MNVLLVYPYCPDDRIHLDDVHAIPTGIYYLAALLREKGHSVKILNTQPMKERPGDIRLLIERERPDVIGFSILNANRWAGIEIARMAKAMHPETVTVFGGIGATFLWELLIADFDEIDYVVLGEGEKPFLALVEAVGSGHADQAASLPGIACRRNGIPRRTPSPAPVADLDQLPHPGRHFSYQHLITTRGCPSDCSFCGSPRFWGRRIRSHSPAYIAEEIALLSRKGVNLLYVSDDTFTLSRNRVIETCRAIIAKQIPVAWTAISRVDCVDEEMLIWMRRAGCIQISYGVESGSPEIRRALGKRFSDAQIRSAFRQTVRCGMMARAYFIYGAPGESDRTIAQTLHLIQDIRPLSAIFYMLSVFPGTALYDAFKRQFDQDDTIWRKRIESIPWCEWDPGLSAERIVSYGQTLRREYHGSLSRFAADIELAPRPDLAPYQADFLSRLGMTFLEGEYADNKMIADAPATAQALFARALALHPDARAFLGAGMVRQKQRDFESAVHILTRGAAQHPNAKDLHICLAVSHMNLGQFQEALPHLIRWESDPQIRPYIAACRQALRRGR